MFQNFNTLANPTNTNGQSLSYRLTCQRRDSAVAWVLFTLKSINATNVIGPVRSAFQIRRSSGTTPPAPGGAGVGEPSGITG